MKLALALVATVLLLAGCGRADPFVGTWRVSRQDSTIPVRLIIAKVGGTYRVALVMGGGGFSKDVYVRHGDQIVSEPGRQFPKTVVTYVPSTGHVLFHVGSAPNLNLYRESDSTSIPTPP